MQRKGNYKGKRYKPNYLGTIQRVGDIRAVVNTIQDILGAVKVLFLHRGRRRLDEILGDRQAENVFKGIGRGD